MTEQIFGPDYVWESEEEYLQTMKRLSMTPYQMAREFRTTFGQKTDVGPLQYDIDGWAGQDDETAFGLIEEEFDEVHEAWFCEPELTSEAFLKELADLVYVVYGYAAFRGWNLDKALARVHLSNMSKVDPVTGQVLKREDGKVLKPPTYKPPYLGDLV